MSEELENENLKEESVLLDEYKKLQESTVSKEKYEADMKALKEKNELYLKAITEGGKVDTTSEEDINIQEAISELSKFKGTNLEYWDKMTKATDQALKTLPKDVIEKMVGADGLEEIIKVKEGMRKMVDDSNGDPDYFRTLYKNRIQDSSPRMSAEINKAGGVVEYIQSVMQKNQK
jgi:flagellar biosynthesis chaperone FliJ